ncbi:MAG: heptosyltransferase-1 [Phycisphaerales bacterium]
MAKTPKSILLIRPSALGDVCRSVPLVASLRAAYPDAAIDWLVQDTFVQAVEHHPGLRRVVPFPRKKFGRQLKLGRPLEFTQWLYDLRGAQYDLAIDAQGLFRSGLFTWWTRAPRRIGYANAQEFAWLGYTEKHPVLRDRHAVDRMLGLLAASGIEPVHDMRLYSAPAERDWVKQNLPGRYAVLAPTSRWVAKQWPDDRFADLATKLLKDPASNLDRIVLVGGPNESEQVPQLVSLGEKDSRVTDIIGSTSIARLMAVVEGASLVVANDSAALHMAVGFDRPVVALFGPTRVELVGPYRREADVIRGAAPQESASHETAYDHKDPANRVAMEGISVEDVLRMSITRLGSS